MNSLIPTLFVCQKKAKKEQTKKNKKIEINRDYYEF